MTQGLVLAIETSCDETAAAVVADGKHVLSSVVSSQVDIHAQVWRSSSGSSKSSPCRPYYASNCTNLD